MVRVALGQVVHTRVVAVVVVSVVGASWVRLSAALASLICSALLHSPLSSFASTLLWISSWMYHACRFCASCVLAMSLCSLALAMSIADLNASHLCAARWRGCAGSNSPRSAPSTARRRRLRGIAQHMFLRNVFSETFSRNVFS